MNKNIILVLVLCLAVAGGSFFAGVTFQKTKQIFPGQQSRNFGQRIQNGQQRIVNGGFRPVNGEIISIDDKSFTVKLNEGSSKIVLITDNTVINKAIEASVQDLKNGDKVAVFGQTNSDGSVTAQNIQINPIFQRPNQTNQ